MKFDIDIVINIHLCFAFVEWMTMSKYSNFVRSRWFHYNVGNSRDVIFDAFFFKLLISLIASTGNPFGIPGLLPRRPVLRETDDISASKMNTIACFERNWINCSV